MVVLVHHPLISPCFLPVGYILNRLMGKGGHRQWYLPGYMYRLMRKGGRLKIWFPPVMYSTHLHCQWPGTCTRYRSIPLIFPLPLELYDEHITNARCQSITLYPYHLILTTVLLDEKSTTTTKTLPRIPPDKTIHPPTPTHKMIHPPTPSPTRKRTHPPTPSPKRTHALMRRKDKG